MGARFDIAWSQLVASAPGPSEELTTSAAALVTPVPNVEL